MDWFERLVGFAEGQYEETTARLQMDGDRLVSIANGGSWLVGEFEVASLLDLRTRALAAEQEGRLRVSLVPGDVGVLHRDSRNAGALFQVASQFNMLEMVGPDVRPEDGVTRYEYDRTQGPACAIAAGAATIYRNYFAPVGDRIGQSQHRQLDGLRDVGRELSTMTGLSTTSLWEMRNGYALCSREALAAISAAIGACTPAKLQALRDKLAIGLHWNTEVTNGAPAGQVVAQAFCSALPVAYTRVERAAWGPFAQLVLDAAYEATLWAGCLNLARGGAPAVYLTSLGGGAFGNDDAWIISAMRRALDLASGLPLDVRIVSYGVPSAALTSLVSSYGS